MAGKAIIHIKLKSMKPRSKLFSFYNYTESKFILQGIQATQKVTVSSREPGGPALQHRRQQPPRAAALAPGLGSPCEVFRLHTLPQHRAAPGKDAEEPQDPRTGCGDSPGLVPHPAARSPPPHLAARQPQARLGAVLVPSRGEVRPSEPLKAQTLGSPALQELFASFTVLSLFSGHFPASERAAEPAAPLV